MGGFPLHLPAALLFTASLEFPPLFLELPFQRRLSRTLVLLRRGVALREAITI